MSRAAQRQQGAASLWVIVVLVLVLAGLLTWMHLGREADILDAQRLAELQKAKLPQKLAGMATGEWPQWRGPNRDGISPDTGLLPVWPEDLAQLKVWEALLRIPPGAVVSYDRLAAHLGKPGSARAVAGAVALNPVSWLVPCHRVIRGTGMITGYRWGPSRKRAMLAWESARREKIGAAD